MKPDRAEIKESMRRKLSIGRYEHSLGVAYTAVCLAMRYGCDIEDAEVAGLLHDCAKQFDGETLLRKCTKRGIDISEAERRNPSLLHAKYGAYLAEKNYDVTDADILNAIRYHTTGRPGMSMMEKIIYVADYIEPRRNKAPDLAKIRAIAFVDIDKAMYEIMKDTLGYLEQSGAVVDDTTMEAYMWIEKEYYGSVGRDGKDSLQGD